jgi:hypothetical protein
MTSEQRQKIMDEHTFSAPVYGAGECHNPADLITPEALVPETHNDYAHPADSPEITNVLPAHKAAELAGHLSTTATVERSLAA